VLFRSGQTERVHRVLEHMLRSYCFDDQTSWDAKLRFVAFAYNNSKQESTGYSPFYLTYGYHPHTPPSLLQHAGTNSEPVNEFLTRMNADLENARSSLLRAQQRQKHYADQKRRELSFSVGDMVMLSAKNTPTLDGDGSAKMKPHWTGPYEVVVCVGKVAYKLHMPNTREYSVYHVSLLKPYLDGSQQFPLRAIDSEPPPAFFVQKQSFWCVEKILRARTVRKQKQYEVQWVGYEKPTWQLASTIATDVPDLAAAFEQERSALTPGERRGRRPS